ncbi:MAG: hypothetical protein C5B53_13835 [Candidatus Melainabacteria bacterium]|nr:MAG: hypothetical protein C5B53_13835 [Candidatus Melainabacteria bacterium]
MKACWSGSTCHEKFSIGLRPWALSGKDDDNTIESAHLEQSALPRSGLDPSKKSNAKRIFEKLVTRLIGLEYNIINFASLTGLLRSACG